jgi:hypothetical protein
MRGTLDERTMATHKYTFRLSVQSAQGTIDSLELKVHVSKIIALSDIHSAKSVQAL